MSLPSLRHLLCARAFLWTFVCMVWLWSVPAWAAPAPASVRSVDVSLRIFEGGERRSDGKRVPRKQGFVRGRATYHLTAPAVAGQELVLLDFAAFLREDPIELDEAAVAGYVNGPFDAGQLDVLASDGAVSVQRRGSRKDVVVSLRTGTQEVTLEYVVTVPSRPWPFGCVRRTCSLSGAVAPLPSVPAKGGRYLPAQGRVVAPVPWKVLEVQLGSRPVQPSVSVGSVGQPPPERVVVSAGRGEPMAYPSVFWGPHWHRTRGVRDGVEIDVFHRRPRPSGRTPAETRLQLWRDLPGHVETTAQEMVALLTAAHPVPPGERVVAVVGPLRSEVAQAHPATLVVSDQALELFPSGRFEKFHIEALARGWADVFAMGMFVGEHDPSTDLWLGGSVALALLDLWRARKEHADEFAGDILRNLTFVPAVDRFLYTQQASFSQTYFRGVEDDPPLRNHPLWFSHALPTGRRLHGKLTDTLGPQRVGSFYDALLRDLSSDPQALAEGVYGHALDWFFDQWLGEYPDVDYWVGDVDSVRVPSGWQHTITIHKRSAQPVVEPVQVLVTDKDGGVKYLVWNGQASQARSLSEEPLQGSHTFVVQTEGKLDVVRLDPRKRLVQTPIAPDNVDPVFNDRDTPQFRFLYTGAGLSVAASEFVNANTPAASFNAIAGFAAFEASLRRDLRSTGHVLVARDRESIIAVGSGVNLWWGKKANPQRRRGRVRLFMTGGWLSDGSLDPTGGVRITERVSVIHDTRRFAWWPERGRALSLGVMARQTLRDRDGRNDNRLDIATDAAWVHLWPLAHDHVLATSLRGELVVPLVRDPEFRSLTRVGGIGGLGGYAADEAFGLGQVALQAEYRHQYLRNMHSNLAHLLYGRSIGGVAFVGAATTSRCDSYGGWFGADSWYAHVGYALTARLSILGVTPQLLKVEASVPLIRRNGIRCLDRVLPDFLAQRQGLESADALLPPFNINVLFNQSF